MVELVVSLKEDQRNAVKNIGFGAIFGFKMGPIPTALGWWLVKNYDTKTWVLNCGSHQIPITQELVHEIFGVPRGNIEVQEVERARADLHEVVAEWKSQFENDPKRLTPIQFKTYMQAQRSSGRIFVLNFLLFYNTLLGETNKNSTLNMRFLPSLHRGLDIKNFSWCEYMLKCLDRNVDRWLPKDCFFGPMALLVAVMVRDQKKFSGNEQRTKHFIEEIVQDDIDSLSIKVDSARFDQPLGIEQGLNPVQCYRFEKKESEDEEDGTKKGEKADQGNQECVQKVERRVLSRKTKHVPLGEEGKSQKVVGSEAKRAEADKPEKATTEKVGGTVATAVNKESDVDVVQQPTDVAGDIPENPGKTIDVEVEMNIEGLTSAEDYCVNVIERYYIESGEYGQMQNELQEPGVHIGFDGELRIPMVSQILSTPPASQDEEVHAGMLEVFFNQFEECVKRINGTFAEGFILYPSSQKIKEKHTMWKDILMKVAAVDTPTGQPHTPEAKTPDPNKNKENVEMSQWSQWTPTFFEEVMKTVEKTTIPQK